MPSPPPLMPSPTADVAILGCCCMWNLAAKTAALVKTKVVVPQPTHSQSFLALTPLAQHSARPCPCQAQLQHCLRQQHQQRQPVHELHQWLWPMHLLPDGFLCRRCINQQTSCTPADTRNRTTCHQDSLLRFFQKVLQAPSLQLVLVSIQNIWMEACTLTVNVVL